VTNLAIVALVRVAVAALVQPRDSELNICAVDTSVLLGLIHPGCDTDIAPVVCGLRRRGDPFRTRARAIFRVHRQTVVGRVEVADIAGVRPLLRGTGFAGSAPSNCQSYMYAARC
jgi:hypothetical protein